MYGFEFKLFLSFFPKFENSSNKIENSVTLWKLSDFFLPTIFTYIYAGLKSRREMWQQVYIFNFVSQLSIIFCAEITSTWQVRSCSNLAVLILPDVFGTWKKMNSVYLSIYLSIYLSFYLYIYIYIYIYIYHNSMRHLLKTVIFRIWRIFRIRKIQMSHWIIV